MTLRNRKGTITFLNSPRLLKTEHQKEFDERRLYLASCLEAFLLMHPLFEGKDVRVTFSHTGISSLVSVLDGGDKTFVLKIPLKIGYSQSESIFLKKWEEVGVYVPHVIETGDMQGFQYMLMDYIDSSSLREKYTVEELISQRTYYEMGALLRKMHTTSADGYGDLINGKAEFPDIRAWLENSSLREKFSYVKEHNLLEEYDSFEESLQTLYRTIGSHTSTVYGHSDFSIGNIFATTPLTVFDPIPFLNHPYMDLGRSLVLAARAGLKEPQAQLLEGYFGEEAYDKSLLRASTILNVYMKLPYWHERDRLEEAKKLQDYMKEIRTGG